MIKLVYDVNDRFYFHVNMQVCILDSGDVEQLNDERMAFEEMIVS